jgi:hypothetical protein
MKQAIWYLNLVLSSTAAFEVLESDRMFIFFIFSSGRNVSLYELP